MSDFNHHAQKVAVQLHKAIMKMKDLDVTEEHFISTVLIQDNVRGAVREFINHTLKQTKK